MNFGVVIHNYGKQAGRLAIVDAALAAEKLGFESLWLTDHVALPEEDAARFGHIFESLTTLAYLAACTARIRLGVSALVLPQRHPVEVAKKIATLDVLSAGRTLLAVGIGWSAGEYANLGQSFGDRGQRMDEAIKVLRTLWRGGQVASFKGQYYSFEKLFFAPGPLQAGGPPLWVAGDSMPALRRAVLLADGWHPHRLSPHAIKARLDAVRPQLGQRPFTVCERRRLRFSEQPLPEVPLSGSPADIIRQVGEYQAAGVSAIVVDFEADTAAERMAAMQRFAQEVAPAFR